MQYTTHYNLNLPEGTDIVNPLVQDNPNYTAIDTALYNNKLRVIGSASEVKSGTVHAITRNDTDINVFRFTATSNFVTGDTFTVDGTSVTAVLPDGTTPKNGAYVINASVLCMLDGTRLSLVGLEGEVEASEVGYDNSNSGLSATDTQDAIDEVNDNLENIRYVIEDYSFSVSGFDGSATESFVTIPLKSGYKGYVVSFSSNAFNATNHISFYSYMDQNNGHIYYDHNLTSIANTILVSILWVKE